MSIKIIENKKIPLDIPSFSCDTNAVGDHLRCHPLTDLLNVYGFLCVIGRPGSGKTSLTVALMTQKNPRIYKKTHHHLIILIPSNSLNSMEKNPFKGIENIYHELTDETISEIYNKIDSYSQNGEKTLLLIDDMTADLKRTKHIQETMKRIVYNRRHLKTNLIITAQSYMNIPLDVRKNITNLILFKPPKSELEAIFSELIESKKRMFEDIMKLTYDAKHNFLFVNIPSQRLFKNWDELVICEE